MFTDPYAKLCYTAHLTSQFDRVIYIDLDTTFTAYFNAGFMHTNSIIDIYLPSEGRLAAMTKDVLESMGDSSLVIFDSVNSFYNLFPIRQRMGSLNHLLSVLIMLACPAWSRCKCSSACYKHASLQKRRWLGTVACKSQAATAQECSEAKHRLA